MYCTTCGKYLNDTDRFCSNCGTPANRDLAGDSILRRSGLADPDARPGQPRMVDTESGGVSPFSIPKMEPPTDGFKWNVHTFPGHTPKPTEDINFDWGDTGIFKRGAQPGDEIALDPAPRVPEPDGSGEPVMTAFEGGTELPEDILTGRDLEDEIFAEAALVETIPAADEDSKRTAKVDKFYTFNKKNEEFQLLLDREYERIRRGETDTFSDRAFSDGVQEINRRNEGPWPEFNPVEHIAEMTRARELFFGPMEDNYPKPGGNSPEPTPEPEPAATPDSVPEPEVVAEPVVEPAADTEPEAMTEPVFEPAEEAEPETMAEAAPELMAEAEPLEAVAPDTSEALAESENPGEEPLPEADLLPPCDGADPDQPPYCKDPEPVQERGDTYEFVPAFAAEASQAEAAPAEESGPETEPEPVLETQPEPAPEIETSPEPESEAEPEPEPTPAAGITRARPEDDATSIRERWIKFEEEETDEEHRGGKAGKIVIGILILLLLSQLTLIGIAKFAPESAVGQYVEEKARQILLFFTGEDNHSIAIQANRNVPAEDKTGLIQNQLDANQDNAIRIIKYNSDLRFVYGKDYALPDLTNSDPLDTNQWYAKGNGAYAYYDEEAIGTVIAYESAKTLTAGEVFETLEIGEIRRGEGNLYVWVATEIAPGARIEKVLRIEISEQSMNVVEEIDA